MKRSYARQNAENALQALAEALGRPKHEIIALIEEISGEQRTSRLPGLLLDPSVISELVRQFPPITPNPYQVREEIARDLGVSVRDVFICPETGELKVFSQ